MRALTASRCPFSAAQWRGVLPEWFWRFRIETEEVRWALLGEARERRVFRVSGCQLVVPTKWIGGTE